MEYEIRLEEDASDEELRVLSEGLMEYNRSKVGGRSKEPLTFFLRDAEGRIVGGVHGNYSSTSGWLYVAALWVSEGARGGGHGRRLMERVEREAVERGCANAYLDTFSFQAPGFYRKLGYVVFGELEDFPEGHSRIFLRKRLRPRPSLTNA
jgi:GNAT superfamily N-acetyltransferase